jgi:hypothetical protein
MADGASGRGDARIRGEGNGIMSDGVLLRFLANGLIDVGGDDTKLEKLIGAAEDLGASLKKTPSKTAPYSLIAFDPDAPADDPVVLEVLGALAKRWATYVNTFSGTPMAVIRAILLEALVQAAAGDPRVAVALAMSARNALPYMQTGDEREIWLDVITEVERNADLRAEAEWATPSSVAVDKLVFEAPSALKVRNAARTVDQATLAKAIEAAMGPQGSQGVTNGNPYFPQSSPQQWVSEVGPRLAGAIASVVDVKLNATEGTIDLSAPLNALAERVSSHVETTVAAVSSATAGLQRRADLLWWKEAAFSPSARTTYRSLPLFVAAALMAYDLYTQVPMFSPASVSAFLEEAVRLHPAAQDTGERALGTLIEEVSNAKELALLRQVASEMFPDSAGRGPILALLKQNPGDDATFRVRSGVSPETALTAPSWAAWIFRELQAARATHMEATKRRGSKA